MNQFIIVQTLIELFMKILSVVLCEGSLWSSVSNNYTVGHGVDTENHGDSVPVAVRQIYPAISGLSCLYASRK